MTEIRRRMPRVEREQRMLDAAEDVFAEHGYRGASMEDIAERSGVTKPLVYQYFGSKDEIYEACVERARRRLVDEIEDAALAAPPEMGLQIFTERFFRHIGEHRGAWWLLYGEASTGATSAMRERNAELIERLLVRALDAQGLVLEETSLAFLAQVLVGAGEQAGRWWSTHPDLEVQEAIERFTVMAGATIAQAFASAEPAR